MKSLFFFPNLRSFLIGRALLSAIDRNHRAVDKLDAAIREVLQK